MFNFSHAVLRLYVKAPAATSVVDACSSNNTDESILEIDVVYIQFDQFTINLRIMVFDKRIVACLVKDLVVNLIQFKISQE